MTIISREYEIASLIIQRNDEGRVATIRCRGTKLGLAICLRKHVVRKPLGGCQVPPRSITGLVMDIDEVNEDTKVSADVVHVWWSGKEFPEKLAVTQLLPVGSNPPQDLNNDDPSTRKEKALAMGAAIAIGSSSGQVSVANQECD